MVKPSSLINCYILNKITDKKITFDVIPEEISESLGASWDSTDVRGRSAPYFGYAGNEARTVSFSITLHDDLCNDLKGTVKELKGLVYPKYSGSIVIPPYCYVVFGSMVKMTAIVNSVSVSWSGTILGDSKTNNDYYSTAEVSIEFTELKTGKIPTATSF